MTEKILDKKIDPDLIARYKIDFMALYTMIGNDNYNVELLKSCLKDLMNLLEELEGE